MPAKTIYQIVIYQQQTLVLSLKQEPVMHTRQVVDPMMRKRPLAADNRTLMEMLVDMYHWLLNALQNHAPTFSLNLIMMPAKPIYQNVIYQQQTLVLSLKQEPVIYTRQVVDPMMRKRPLAADNRTLMEMLVDMYHWLLNAQQNHAPMFSLKLMILHAKAICQLVNYKQPQHALPLQ